VVSSAQPAPLALAYRSGFNGVNSDQFRSSNGSRGYQPGSFIYNSLEWVSDSSAPLPNYAAFDTRAIGTDNTSSLAFLNNADYVCNIPMNFPTPLGTGVIDQQIQPSLTLPPPSYHGSFNATLWPHLPHYQHPVQQNLSNPQVAIQTYPCSDCTRSFGRKSDRDRHITSVHGTSQIFYLCPVVNCPKSQGKGYSRQDKVTEHLWKKHANLGFTKRV
jgi:hypothetical protein